MLDDVNLYLGMIESAHLKKGLLLENKMWSYTREVTNIAPEKGQFSEERIVFQS